MLLLHVRGHRALLPRAAAVRRGPEDLEAEGLQVDGAAARALHERVQRDAEDGPADVDAHRHLLRRHHGRRRVCPAHGLVNNGSNHR